MANRKRKHTVAVQPASITELNTLGRWYPMTGDTHTDVDAFIEHAARTHEGGILGSATGPSLDARIRTLMDVPVDDWVWACTLVLSLRVDGQTAGMLVIGAHQHFMQWWSTELYGPQATTATSEYDRMLTQSNFMLPLLITAKLQMVAVDPSQRGHGHGRRLINHAVDRLTKADAAMIYGQFVADRDLRAYYTSLGFDVLERGAALDMSMATGRPGVISPQPDETYFVRYINRRSTPSRL